MEKFEVKPGISLIEDYEVKPEHAAKHVGSGEVEVLSTPSMIAFMERTALKCVQKQLPKGFITVGVGVNVKHLKPAPVGAKVTVEAELVKVEGRKLTFKVKAKWKEVTIGEGTHERYIVNKEKFLEKVKRMFEEKSKN
ncbi:MAG: thioesterase family protein [archaeon GB-1867-005]|nr:thioesterase family protein [Candidatus Culexmicrobium cathedralense]